MSSATIGGSVKAMDTRILSSWSRPHLTIMTLYSERINVSAAFCISTWPKSSLHRLVSDSIAPVSCPSSRIEI